MKIESVTGHILTDDDHVDLVNLVKFAYHQASFVICAVIFFGLTVISKYVKHVKIQYDLI